MRTCRQGELGLLFEFAAAAAAADVVVVVFLSRISSIWHCYVL